MILFRNRRFGLLWTSHLLSNIGNWMMIVAVPVHVYALTGSAVNSGLVFIAETAPAIVFAPLAGVLADRWDRRAVMVAADVIRLAALPALLLVDDRGLVWLLYAVVFVENAVGNFFAPAARAAVPAVVGRGPDLDTANSWGNVANGILRLAGAPLGGVLYLVLGFDGLVLLDAGTYLVSALLILAVGRLPVPPAAREPGGPLLSELWRQFREGMSFLSGHRVLRAMLLVSSLFMLANAMLTVLLVPYVVDGLHGDAGTFGLLLSALGVGFLLSAYAGNRMSRSGRLRASIAGCLLGVTVCFAGLFLIPALPSAFAFMLLLGVPGGALMMLTQVQVQRQTPDARLGRVGSAFLAVEMAATVAGAGAGGVLGQHAGLTVTVLLVVATLLAAVALALRTLPARVAADAAPAPVTAPDTVTVTPG